jgi:hypothetical protein
MSLRTLRARYKLSQAITTIRMNRLSGNLHRGLK